MHRIIAKFVPMILTADQKQQLFLAKHKMAVIPHPPCPLALAPCDFFLFPKIKSKLKGCWLDTTEEIQVELQRG
jgi:hypothetical protein